MTKICEFRHFWHILCICFLYFTSGHTNLGKPNYVDVRQAKRYKIMKENMLSFACLQIREHIFLHDQLWKLQPVEGHTLYWNELFWAVLQTTIVFIKQYLTNLHSAILFCLTLVIGCKKQTRTLGISRDHVLAEFEVGIINHNQDTRCGSLFQNLISFLLSIISIQVMALIELNEE
jgi:hypothetical protein